MTMSDSRHEMAGESCLGAAAADGGSHSDRSSGRGQGQRQPSAPHPRFLGRRRGSNCSSSEARLRIPPHRFLDSTFGSASNDIRSISMCGGSILQARYRYRYRYRYRMAGLERDTSIAIAIPIAIAITNKPPVVISRFVGPQGP